MPDKKTSSELIRVQAGDVLNVWDLPSFDDPSHKEEPLTAEPDVVDEALVRKKHKKFWVLRLLDWIVLCSSFLIQLGNKTNS